MPPLASSAWSDPHPYTLLTTPLSSLNNVKFRKQNSVRLHVPTVLHCLLDDAFFTRHSLVRAKGEVLVLLCLFCRFLSTISRQPKSRFTPNFACGRTLVPDVSSPLLGVAPPPRGAGKGGNGIFVKNVCRMRMAVYVSSTDAFVIF